MPASDTISISSSISNQNKYDDYIFDPLDGTFVLVDMKDDSAECSGALSEQGRKDSWALIITLAILSIFLLSLLYVSANNNNANIKN